MGNASKRVDVCVIGGGAAGLMCAITAAQRGKQVVVLEGSNRVGKKILMSGGGRCNFTNLHTSASNFLSSNPHFCKSALSRYTQADFVALVEKYAIRYHEKTLGQLFCDVSSKEIVAMLLAECADHNVSIFTHCDKIEIAHDIEYRVQCVHGLYECASLVIATGGLSIPKMGATDFGYRIARQFGHAIRETRAGLVPFTFSGAMREKSERLSGLSCKVAVCVNKQTFVEDILFTHRGLSGPAALQASSYWLPGDELVVNLLPDLDATELLLDAKSSRSKSLLRSVLSARLPRALVLELQSLIWPQLASHAIAEINDADLRRVAKTLNAWSIRPASTEGYRTAEVTLGGVDSDEISSQTMASKYQPGLYFVGEVVDVTGHLGGHNFQWAWSSGWAAGQSI